MNLVTDAWIPVLDQTGKHRLVSLETAFREGEQIADLAANPCQRVSLARLLVCIVQAALDGPADEGEWKACRVSFASRALDYLTRWRPRFELFGNPAFLQVAGELSLASKKQSDEEELPICDKLDFTLSCGHNATLYDHGATPEGRLPALPDLALRILVYQCFSPGGLSSVARWQGVETAKSVTAAPCVEQSMLITLLKGRNLAEFVHANLVTKEMVRRAALLSWGKPCWETNMERGELDVEASSYLGRLVPCSRAIRCWPNKAQILLAQAVAYPKLPEAREPWATVVMRRNGKEEKAGYLGIDLEKHPWREIDAILSLRQADQSGGAWQLEHLRSAGSDQTFDLWTGGLAVDKSKFLDMAEWEFHFPVAMLGTRTLQAYKEGAAYANEGSAYLHTVIKAYGEAQQVDMSDGPGKKAFWQHDAQQHFWAAMDARVKLLEAFALAGSEAERDGWVGAIREAMRGAYRETCPHETSRQIQAYVRCLKSLESWKPFSLKSERKESVHE